MRKLGKWNFHLFCRVPVADVHKPDIKPFYFYCNIFSRFAARSWNIEVHLRNSFSCLSRALCTPAEAEALSQPEGQPFARGPWVATSGAVGLQGRPQEGWGVLTNWWCLHWILTRWVWGGGRFYCSFLALLLQFRVAKNTWI